MRPSIGLACILKNEINNLPQLLKSVEGCFDEIHLTDTGSNDGSVELIQSWISEGSNPSGSPLFLHHFKWVDDFGKARQASFDPVKTDYIMWLDLDDVLSDKNKFIDWRNTVLFLADFWIATYHYASHSDGAPACSFARERVVKRSLDLKWRYFVHEGILPKSSQKKDLICQYATPWSVIHKRTHDDLVADANRNLSIFEKRKGDLDARMRYYYGKELFEAKKFIESFNELTRAIAETDLELHDRVMGIQYACLSAMYLNQLDRAVQLAHQGLQLAPLRAEFYIVIGDCYLKMQKLNDAIPFFKAASSCPWTDSGQVQGAIYCHEDSYKHYPLNQLARIYVNQEKLKEAEECIEKSMSYGKTAETIGLSTEFAMLKQGIVASAGKAKKKTEEIVITAHPQGPYEWDWDTYKEKGIGGSETACVEMAKWLSELSGREIIVFNNRKSEKKYGNVRYVPATELPRYFNENEPKLHIAWRHNVKLTTAPTYLWCHDLSCPGLDKANVYEKVMALSPFHKNFLKNICGVPEEKIWVTGNGIEPRRFTAESTIKRDSQRVIFSSSPDRGLKRAILVMDEVIKEVDASFHIFYGFDNLLKIGKLEEVARLEAMIKERPWITYHGNVSQSQLTEEIQKSAVWLYPTDFLETYCITAIEMLAGGCYPVVRNYGALPHTMSEVPQHMRTIIDHDCDTEGEQKLYAQAVISAIKEKKYEGVHINPSDYSWQSVASSWIRELGL